MNTLYFNGQEIWSGASMPTEREAQDMLLKHAPSTRGSRGFEEAAENITIGLTVITADGVFRWKLAEDL